MSHAAVEPARPNRILIIGPSGAGKSWLAAQMGARLGLPVIHLDQVYWRPGWTALDRATWRAELAALAAGERWIMDGAFPSSMDVRLPRAELVIWLDLPRRVYFPQALLRTVRHYGRVRPDLAPGCPERLDWAFFRDWVWTYPARRATDAKLMAQLPPGTRGITLSSRRQMRQLVAGLPASLRADSASK